MKRLTPIWTAVLALTTTLTCFPPQNVHAGCCDHVSAQEEDDQSDLILEARVTGRVFLKLPSGKIVTDVTLQPIEIFKGPEQNPPISIRVPGGRVGEEEQFSSQNVPLITGEDYLFRLTSHQNTWKCLNARAERVGKQLQPRRNKYRQSRIKSGKAIQRIKLPPHKKVVQENQTDDSNLSSTQTIQPLSLSSTGYYEDAAGIPGRFSFCDSGEPIQYLVDATYLPPGITQSQALQAVETALDAWTAASGLSFKFAGLQDFGEPAGNIQAHDYKLRVQLHDHYNEITDSTLLGIGGGSWMPSNYTNGGAGGRVRSQEFHKRTQGYCTLNHRATTMQTYSNFLEVLTHELGHAIGLMHSSESQNESNTYLKEASMYYRIHGGNRGATLGNYDITKMDFGYPSSNMPPAGMDRMMYAVTGTPQPSGLGINRITVCGNDQETPDNLTFQMTSGSHFSQPENSTILYTPEAAFREEDNPDITEQQLEEGISYDHITYRISDGVNLSTYHNLRVIGYRYDSTPSDGLPDSWMSANFDTTSVGAVNDPHHPDADPDGDGISNRVEFIYGTDPNAADSYPLKMTYDHIGETVSWNTVNRMPYYLEYSEDLSSWTSIKALLGTGNRVTEDVDSPSNTHQFYRIRLQP